MSERRQRFIWYVLRIAGFLSVAGGVVLCFVTARTLYQVVQFSYVASDDAWSNDYRATLLLGVFFTGLRALCGFCTAFIIFSLARSVKKLDRS